MEKERQARNSLAQFMTKTSEGLQGYQVAVTAIGAEYENLIDLNNTTMNALLKPNAAVGPDHPLFEWHGVLERQATPPAGEN